MKHAIPSSKKRNTFFIAISVLILILSSISIAFASGPDHTNLHCPGKGQHELPEGYVISSESSGNDTVPAAGQRFCVKSGQNPSEGFNTGILVGDGQTSAQDWLKQAGIVDGSGEKGRNVSYIVFYESVEVIGLGFTFMQDCPEDTIDQNIARWRIRNNNDFNVDWWTNTGHSGSAPPGDSFFTTEWGEGGLTVILHWKDENDQVQRNTKARGNALDPDHEKCLEEIEISPPDTATETAPTVPDAPEEEEIEDPPVDTSPPDAGTPEPPVAEEPETPEVEEPEIPEVETPEEEEAEDEQISSEEEVSDSEPQTEEETQEDDEVGVGGIIIVDDSTDKDEVGVMGSSITADSPSLAYTGSNSITLTLLSILMIAFGMGAIMISSRMGRKSVPLESTELLFKCK